MRSRRTRVFRRALLALLAIVSCAVAWNLRRPAQGPSSGATPGGGAVAGGATAKEIVFMRFREGARQIEVKARAKTGQEGAASRLSGVEVTFPFTAEGKTQSAVVRAEECLYQPQPLRVTFRGKVRVRTDDGMELDTEQLEYSAADGTAKSDVDVAFRQGGSSGSGRGMDYRAETGELSLRENVRLRLEQGAEPPADVEAGSLRASRAELRVFLDGGVAVRQGARELHSQKLQLNMTADFKEVERASAIDDADLRIGGGGAVPGASAAVTGGGEKRLRCRKLVVSFRSRGVLAEVTGVNPATLDVQPGPRDPPEKRRLASDLIRFTFDEQGRFLQLEGLGGGPHARRTVMTAEPVGGRGSVRRVESLDAFLSLDPVTGAFTRAVFRGDVQFAEAGRRAWARDAEYEESSGQLKLNGDPRLVDEAQGSELRAQRIEVASRGRAVTADENVRHTITRRGGARPGGQRPLGGDEATVLLCRHLDYDSATKTARYRENALMRSGQDEIRAPLIVLEEPAEGRRRLSASGGVTSTLHPRPDKAQKREPAAVEARSRELVYDEKERRVVYTGDVEIRQGDILTKSPEAIVLLSADGAAVEKLLAGSPVEVRQGGRRATGERGTYTPKDETLVLVGEKVVLQDADRRLEGRMLTFQSGSDRIRVDGREEVRSEAVLKRKDPSRP
jgi:LPS export ABC transporter protein LptC/lipopolysaccharide transport protein LptA